MVSLGMDQCPVVPLSFSLGHKTLCTSLQVPDKSQDILDGCVHGWRKQREIDNSSPWLYLYPRDWTTNQIIRGNVLKYNLFPPNVYWFVSVIQYLLTYTQKYIKVNVYSCVCTRKWICVCVCKLKYMNVDIQVISIYIYICICVCVCAWVRVRVCKCVQLNTWANGFPDTLQLRRVPTPLQFIEVAPSRGFQNLGTSGDESPLEIQILLAWLKESHLANAKLLCFFGGLISLPKGFKLFCFLEWEDVG